MKWRTLAASVARELAAILVPLLAARLVEKLQPVERPPADPPQGELPLPGSKPSVS